MRETEWKKALVAGVAILLSPTIAQAADVFLTGSVLTTYSSIIQGKRTPAKIFSLEDVIRYYAAFSWKDITLDGGSHDVTWNWYRHGELVSTESKKFLFQHAPYNVWTSYAAADFGPGNYQIDVLIDNEVASSVKFQIK